LPAGCDASGVRGADIFINYRRQDAGDAGRLTDWLVAHFGQSRVFIDVTGIEGGQQFPDRLSEAIRECRAFIAIVTPRWAAELHDPDDWVRREVREALAAGRPVIPVLVHGAPPPARSDLPPDLAEMADTHAHVLSDVDFRDDVGRLIETLERVGVERAIVDPLPGVSLSARAEKRDAWDAPDDRRHAFERLEAALLPHGIRVTGEDGDVWRLEGGEKLKARLLGGFTGPESRLPSVGLLRIGERGAMVAIEVLLAEAWGRGVLSPLDGRYLSFFDKVMTDLRRATSRR
jgi:hypothetical protein